MDVLETSVLEELVGGLSKVVSDSGHCSNVLSSRAHVSNLSQVLDGVVFTCKRVSGRVTFTINFN